MEQEHPIRLGVSIKAYSVKDYLSRNITIFSQAAHHFIDVSEKVIAYGGLKEAVEMGLKSIAYRLSHAEFASPEYIAEVRVDPPLSDPDGLHGKLFKIRDDRETHIHPWADTTSMDYGVKSQ